MLAAARAGRLASTLDLDVDDLRLCPMCLWGVGMEIDGGRESKIRGALIRFTPLLWDEGLAAPARAAVEAAARRGVPDATAALADLDDRGPRTPIARAIVRRLATQQAERARTAWEAMMN